MAGTSPSCPGSGESTVDSPTRGRPDRWWLAVALALVLLGALGWLLARLIWLPFYLGLFFFLIAGLLVGAFTFRFARPARPVSKGRIIVGVALIAVVGSLVTSVWEYRGFAATAGGERQFPEARNAAVAAGRPVREVEALAAEAFRQALRDEYPPGGLLGYIGWAIHSGEMELTVGASTDTVTTAHRGLAWPIRTAAGMLLLAVGLWLSFESLRSATPVSNILAPGEEAEDEP